LQRAKRIRELEWEIEKNEQMLEELEERQKNREEGGADGQNMTPEMRAQSEYEDRTLHSKILKHTGRDRLLKTELRKLEMAGAEVYVIMFLDQSLYATRFQ
jgi:hypothetical protein